VAGSQGTPVGTPRRGARRAAKPKRSLQPKLVALALAAVAALVGWGVLVWLAVDYGRSARGGDSGKWAYLAAASIGAVVCLFLCLWLGTLLLRRLGILDDPRPRPQSQTHRH
jgi:hypothetical protein